MKAIHVKIVLPLLICTFTCANVRGQVVAIGHASAEVVESVSASSKAVTGFNLNNNVTAIKDHVNFNTEKLNMGSITINSGTNVACNLVLHSATLSDARGNGFAIDTTTMSSGQSDPGQVNGTQTIQINGTARMLAGQTSGLYRGTYTMVFAYN